MMMVQQEQQQTKQQQQQHHRALTSGQPNRQPVRPGGSGTTSIALNVSGNNSQHPKPKQQPHNSQQGQQSSNTHTRPGSGRQPLLQQQSRQGRAVGPVGPGGVRRQQSLQQQQNQNQNQNQEGADEDPEQQDEDSTVRRRRQRPLYRRIYQYVREAWIGVQSTLDSELEDLETPPRYRPDSLEALCKATRFSQSEIKRIYRGFKAECPTGVVREDTFKMIYAQFFPQGANSSQYAHYVFNTLDPDHNGLISFEDFVHNLSILSRGSLDEKLKWAFTLYDINGDGCITKEEMTDIVSAVYELMGKLAEPTIEEDTIKEKVDRIFQKMDKNGDGVVTLDEFLECCHTDEDISASMAVFDSAI